MIRIVIADDHTIVREGLKQLLAATDDFEVVGEARDGHETMKIVRERDFDVLLLDLSMPGKSGMELIKQVRSEKPKLRILVLSMHAEHQYAVRAIKAGASGYLTKDSAATGARVRAPQGRRGRCASSAPRWPSSSRIPRCRRRRVPRTRRCPIASSRSSSCSWPERPCPTSRPNLNLSVKTVSTHKARIFEKMGLGNQAELIRYAIRHRLGDDTNDAG